MAGNSEGSGGQRFFRYHSEDSLRATHGAFSNLEIMSFWETPDQRPGHSEVWLNCLVRKL